MVLRAIPGTDLRPGDMLGMGEFSPVMVRSLTAAEVRAISHHLQSVAPFPADPEGSRNSTHLTVVP